MSKLNLNSKIQIVLSTILIIIIGVIGTNIIVNNKTMAVAVIRCEMCGGNVTTSTTNATCTTAGKKEARCQRCGDVMLIETIPAKGHSYGDWVIDKFADCVNAGVRHRICFNCENKQTETIPALGGQHSYGEEKIEKYTTCTEDGRASQTCSVCGYVKYIDYPASGHVPGEWTITKEPTCVEKGEKQRNCIACYENPETKTIPIDKTKHRFNTSCRRYSTTINETCTQSGKAQFYCGNKGCDAISGDIDVPPYGHNFNNQDLSAIVPGSWVDGTCTESIKFRVYCMNYDNRNNRRCDAQSELIDYGKPLGHDMKFVSNNEEICKQCSRCSVTEKHDMGYVDRKATCKEEGIRMDYCTKEGCNFKCVYEVYPKLTTHTPIESTKETANEPTCTYVGKYRYLCAVCNSYYWVNGTNTLPHSYENGKCTVCGCKESEQTVQGITQFNAKGRIVADIPLNTLADGFATGIRNQNENAEVKLYNANNESIEENEKLATGMKMEVTKGEETYSVTLVIRGDVDGNGEYEFTDITRANKNRLNKEKLDVPYFRAADVNNDEKVDFMDLIKLNKFRLNKITEL